MQLNDLRVNLTLDNDGFKITVKDSERILRQFGQTLASTDQSVKKLERSYTGLIPTLMRGVQTLGMARFALMDLHDIFLALPKAIINSAGEMERMTKLMEGLSKETTEAARKIEAIKNVKFVMGMAQNTPFEVKALTDAMVKLKTGGIDPTNGSLRSLADGIAKFGGSSEQMHRASIAIQQMGGKGVVSMEELRQQLGEAVPTAMQAMAEGMNMTMAELTNAVTKGTVASTMAMKKMLVVMGIVNQGAAAAMMDTWVGMLAQLKTKWTLFQTDIAGAGLLDGVKKELKNLIDAFDGVKSAQFGREIGRTLASITESIVEVIKKAIEFGDTIIAIAKILAVYWVASKLSGPIDSMRKSMGVWNDMVKDSAAKAQASVIAKQEGAKAEILARAEVARAKIKENSDFINAEKATTAAARAQNAAKLQDSIATNQAINRQHEQTIAKSIAVERALATSAAVRATKNGGGTPDQHLETQVLMRHADMMREKAALADADMTRKERQIARDREHLTLLNSTTGALSAEALQRQSNNRVLQDTAGHHENIARGIGRGNAAWAQAQIMANNAWATVKGIGGSVFGIEAAIMLAAAAWDYFERKAREAARATKAAMDLAKKTKDGTVEREDVDNAETKNTMRSNEIGANNKLINLLDKPGADNATKKRVEELRDQNKKAQEAIDLTNKEMAAAREQSVKKDGERSVASLRSVIDREETKITEVLQTQRQNLTEAYDNKKNQPEFKTNKAEAAKLLTEYKKNLEENHVAILKARQDFRLSKSADLAKESRDSAFNPVKKEAARLLSDQLRKEAADFGEDINTRRASNDILPGKDKKPKRDPQDAVTRALAAEYKKVAQNENMLDQLVNGMDSYVKVKERVANTVSAMIAGDLEKDVPQVHSPEQKQKLIDAMSMNSVLDAAEKKMGDSEKKAEKLKEQALFLQEQIMTGNFQTTAATEEQGMVKFFKDLQLAIPQATKEIQKFIDKAEGLRNWSGMAEMNKRIADMTQQTTKLVISNKIYARERIAAENALELKELDQKYAAELSAAKLSGQNVTDLIATQAKLREQIVIAHAEKMKTPLEKLGDEWKDVTGNMQNATRRWSEDALDKLLEFTETGKLNFKGFVVSILKDVSRINMQQGMGKLINGAMKGVGDWVQQRMLPSSEQNPTGYDPKGGENGFFSGLMTSFKGWGSSLSKMTATTDEAGNVMEKSFIESMWDSIKQMIFGTTTQVAKMTVEQKAAVSLTTLSMATDNATLALMNLAASSGGGSSGGMWASLITTAISAYSGMGGGTGVTGSVDSGTGAMSGGGGLGFKSSGGTGFKFADGGIMSQFGSLSLNKYLNGGIANSPQLALFGEGRMNEAYVPLPDGRSIPVTMQGGGSGQSVMIQINIDKSGEESSSASGDEKGNWNKLANRVKGVVREEMATQMRQGGILAK